MKWSKKILLALLVAIIALQFIRPMRNQTIQVLRTDFTKIYAVPSSVQIILKNACYDCHSNNTRYPWYVNTQPLGWIMSGHIRDGKEKLNFSEFGSYSSRRQQSKLKGIASSIRDDIMPISSYRRMHKTANLSRNDKLLVMDWVQKKADSLSSINN